MNPEVSVIIPARNEYPQICFTVDSVQQAFGNIAHEVIVVFDKNTDDGPKYMSGKGHCIKIEQIDSGSCWVARSHGASIAKGKYLLFFDGHVLINNKTISLLLDFYKKQFDVGICWVPVRYLLDSCEPKTRYDYGLKLVMSKFWGDWTSRKLSNRPYRLLMGGMAGMLISKEKFDYIRGFNGLIHTYVGGESLISFKSEMFGFHNYIHPDAGIAHFAANRGYCWKNDDLWQSFLAAAYITGGDRWLQKQKDYYIGMCRGVKRYLENLDLFCEQTKQLCANERIYVEKNAKFTLDEILEEYDNWLERKVY